MKAMGALPKPIRPVTVQDFLDSPPHPQGLREQLVDGVVVAMSPPSSVHAQLQLEIGALLRAHLRSANSTCVAMTGAGVVPRQDLATNVRIPDVLVTCSDEDKRARVIRSPVLVIEVLSPSNERQTRANVWAYQSIPSVREIVLLHSQAIAAEVRARATGEPWPDVPHYLGEDDRLRLDSIGADFALRDVYATIPIGED
ncbi:MAG TPA: Uma2 family endonuclease [Acidisphaera sp.]|nr:Uma2 family endonuclease [Acidisphaera sp.]